MKLRIFIALLTLLTIAVPAHSLDSWPLSFFTHNKSDSGWKERRKSIIKRSVLFGRANFTPLSSKQVAERTALILDTWHKYRATKLKHIKDPEIAVALAWTESAMQPKSTSKTHDKGLMQVCASTARDICTRYNISYNRKSLEKDLELDSPYNVLIGLCELDNNLRQWKGKLDLAVIGYKVGQSKLRYLLKKGGLSRHYTGLYASVDNCCHFLTGTAQVQTKVSHYISPTHFIMAGEGTLTLS